MTIPNVILLAVPCVPPQRRPAAGVKRLLLDTGEDRRTIDADGNRPPHRPRKIYLTRITRIMSMSAWPGLSASPPNVDRVTRNDREGDMGGKDLPAACTDGWVRNLWPSEPGRPVRVQLRLRVQLCWQATPGGLKAASTVQS